MHLPHDYLSTACFHGLHELCRQTCKYCSSPCLCQDCKHNPPEQQEHAHQKLELTPRP